MHIDTTNVCFQKEKDHFLKVVALLVIVLHGIFLCTALFFQTDALKIKRNHQKLIVQTINLKPVQNTPLISIADQENLEEMVEIASAPAVKEPLEILNENVTPKEPPKEEPAKKIEPKKVTPKKVEPIKKVEPKPFKKAEPIKKVEPAKKIEPSKISKPINKVEHKKTVEKSLEEISRTKAKQELLAIAKQNLAKIDKASPSKTIKKAILPEQIGTLSVDAAESSNSSGTLNVREIGYRDELGARLKNLLKLPEHGQVQIKLTLSKLGKFIRVEIVNAESQINKKYIETTVKTLTFPSFQGAFKEFPEYTFSITLK